MNDHVAEPFRTILNGFAGPKRSLQGQRVQNRERFRIVESIHAELQAAGAVLEIGQLDWAAKEINDRLYEKSMDEQYEAERARDKRQAENDREWEQAVIEARDRFANEGDK